ncbi:MAG: aspartate aminotransferase family protein [Bacteroidales bacterium]|nr:aspartate aminotransferase family protein [Bacteroidales bacterium]
MITNRELFFRHMGLPSKNPLGIEIDHASGIYIYDNSGKEYLDLVSGVAVSNLGHRHPKVIEAIHQQLEKYMHLMVYGEYIQSPQVKLAKLLVDNLPQNLDAVYFVNSGSEANEGAIKLAKRYTGRTEIVAFKNAYHGGTHGALSVLGNETLKYAFRPLLPDIRFLNFNRFEDLSQITERTSCVIAESIQAEAGIILPENNFLTALRKRCDETGALLILDDIQMGFGRTGKLFSFENYNFTPDILTLAKGMGGGMPIGAFISSKEIMESLTSKPELGHITTFGGHPVCCAAALANLLVILDEKLAEGADKKGKHYKEILLQNDKIQNIRQIGLMLGIDLENNELASKLANIFVKNGLITDRFLFRPNAFRIAPPLIIKEDEIEKSINRILESLDQL